MEKMRKKEDNFHKWLSALTPLYGEREAKNMWQWYEEAARPKKVFDEDLNRLLHHYPIKYLIGYTYFYGDKYLVNEDTLIPRPETEELVFKILEDHPDDKTSLRIIDLGTGTGCIPISLKKRRPSWEVTGLDLYEKALYVARKNSQLHDVEVIWKKQDILTLSITYSKNYDIVVSNPPYIPPDEKSLMNQNVLKYEPAQALFTRDHDGLEFYRAIAAYGQKLSIGTEFYLELNENASSLITALFEDSKLFTSSDIIQDLQGKNRILHLKRQ